MVFHECTDEPCKKHASEVGECCVCCSAWGFSSYSLPVPQVRTLLLPPDKQ